MHWQSMIQIKILIEKNYRKVLIIQTIEYQKHLRENLCKLINCIGNDKIFKNLLTIGIKIEYLLFCIIRLLYVNLKYVYNGST